MDRDLFQSAAKIFEQARNLDPAARSRLLDEACAGDDELRAQVESLLEHHEQTGAPLESPLLEVTLDPARLAARDRSDETPSVDRIGGYRIVGTLGTGGMGVVYLAEQDNPARRVALKIIRSGLASRQLLRRFEHESQVLGRLKHPGIAQIYEAGTADSGDGAQPFFAMEHVEGPALLEHARDLDTRARLDLMARICDAVHHAHQRGVIHRDLKPGNILVESGGEGAAQPKVLDFGVARVTDSDVQVTTIQTDVGQLLGTIAYMSPEQVVADPAELDIRSDVYALGVILYEMLAGRLPYEIKGRPITEAARLIREQEPVRLSTVDRVLGGDVEVIVAKALEKDRERRYESAADLAADIRRYLDAQPIMARPATALYQFRRLAARHKVPTAALAALALLIVGSTIVSTVQAGRVTRQRDLAVDAETRAEARFDQIWELARSLVFDLDARIRDLPGSAETRHALLDMATEHLDTLRAQSSDDPQLQAELTQADRRIRAIRRDLETGVD